ncbi:MAG: hypothetical protein OEN56_12310 [Gemmatimonadota bacterium]|nr:hypothetical protein [Gemmatimonadota bacterium]
MRPAHTLSIFAASLALGPGIVSAQGFGTPSRLAEVELARSRDCVAILARVEVLNAEMEPIARRSQRLTAIAQAIALEERSIIDSLNVEDPVEARVREWFANDASLARRYVNQPDASLAAERTANRETIKATVTRAITGLREEASAKVADNQALIAEAAPCDGAIFVRSAVLTACETGSGPICEDARLAASEGARFRFVDDAASIWEIEEIRPWTQPGPLRPGATGLDGGRTIGFTRVGNVVATVALTPLFAPKAQVPPEALAAYEATNDSLGLAFSHPNLVFTPALGIRVALPQPLDEETGYVLHFGEPDDADVVWMGDAGTGAPLEATVPLSPSQVRRLATGDPLMLTAVQATEDTPDAVFAIGIGNVNQARNAQALLTYMASQLSADVTQLIPPSSGS